MTRIRIMFGAMSLLLAAPVFVVSIFQSDAPAGAYVLGAVGTAVGIALLWPYRWTHD